MKFVKFATQEQAEGYRARLQAHHDATHTEGPRIVDCIVPTYDGIYALTLIDDDYPATDGEIVDSISPPVEEDENGIL
jgi:hypothetical protein